MSTKTYDVGGRPVTVPRHLQRGFESADPKAVEWPKDKPQNAEQIREKQDKETSK